MKMRNEKVMALRSRNAPQGGWASANWSGYAIPSPQRFFSHVQAKWIVPRVKPSRSGAYSSVWIGIDGFNNSSLIQTGTEHDYVGGKPIYQAWWEILPQYEKVIHRVPVKAGDRIFAEIRRVSKTHWAILIRNLSNGRQFVTIRTYRGPQRSVEWILEAPSVNGKITNLAHLTPTQLCGLRVNGRIPALIDQNRGVMIQKGRIVASPSKFHRRGAGFTVYTRQR